MKSEHPSGRDLLNRRFSSRRFHFHLIAFLSLAILFPNLRKGDLSGYDDAAYAHQAKQVLATGDWWNIRLNGHLDFDKPPLFIWLEAGSMKLFGVSDFAAKFPSALLGFGCILLVYFIASEITEAFWSPILAMFIMMSTQYFIKYAMHAMTCVPFTFFFSLAIFLYLRGLKRPAYFVGCGIAVGLATLIRSPIGLIALGIMAIHLHVTGKSRTLLGGYLVSGILVALLAPSVWYLSQYQIHGSKFLRQHFSNIAAHASSGQPRNAWSATLSYLEYPALLLKLYWPWLPFMAFGLWIQARNALRREDRGALLLVLWVACVVVPFSLAESKVLRYIMPAFPAFSILSSIPLTLWLRSERIVNGLKVGYLFAIVAVVGMILWPNYLERAKDMRQLAPITDASTEEHQFVLLYAYGDNRWDYRNQLIWYGGRFCELVTDLGAVRSTLQRDRGTVVIMDKASLPQLTTTIGMKLVVLGESEKFVCFKALAGPAT